ncbi:MAG: hypothetical protein ACJ8DI_24370 [Ktedonobacteraceae bacterium]
MTKLRKASISTAIALIVTLSSMLFQVTSISAARSAAASQGPTLSVSSNLTNRRPGAAPARLGRRAAGHDARDWSVAGLRRERHPALQRALVA